MIVVVIIPHRDQVERLRKAVSSVQAHAPATTVLVVDDSLHGCPDLGVAILRSGGHSGFAVAVNAGLGWAEAEGHGLALLLNDDAELQPGCLAALEREWSEADGALAPVLAENEPAYGIELGRLGRMRVRRHEHDGTLSALSGACILLRTTERFDERFAHGFEDVELCQRLAHRGLRIRVINDAHCVHLGGGTIDRRTAAAQRHALSGHLRVLPGYLAPVAIALGVLQVLRERGGWRRLVGIGAGIMDWVRRR